MKNLFVFSIICFFAVIIFQPLCSQTQKVKVQIINNIPDANAGNLNVSVNGDSKSGTDGLAFRQATAFFEITALSDYVSVTYNGNNHQFNVPPAGDAVIFIYTGVLVPENFDNPFNRTTLKMADYAGMYAETTGSLGKVALTIFHGTTDAPTLSVVNRNNNEKWASKIDYFNWSGYVSSPDKDPKNYEIELRSFTSDTVVGAYKVELTNYGNKALCLFTSGFINPAKNQNGPALGLFAADADGNVIEFPSFNVKVKPSIPTLLMPNDNAVDQSSSGNLTWEAVNGTKKYNLQISKSNDFNQNIVDKNNLTTNSYPYQNFESETKYFWHVSATNDYGTSDWSPIRNFTIKKYVNKPGKPILCYPPNDTINLEIKGILKWNKIAVADKYSLEIATDIDFLYTVDEEADIVDTTYEYSKLKYNKQYYWHVSGENSAGEGNWSEPRAFKTKNNTSVLGSELSENDILISPNPARDYINIQPSEDSKLSEGYDIQIFDMLGINIFPVGGGIKRGGMIDISNLSPGIYFIKIGNKVEKFVKI